MDRAVDPTAAEQARIRGVDDRIDCETRNIAVIEPNAGMGCRYGHAGDGTSKKRDPDGSGSRSLPMGPAGAAGLGLLSLPALCRPRAAAIADHIRVKA